MAAAIHDIDSALLAKRKVGLLALDVALAFPSIRLHRLCHCIINAGLGAACVLFAERFMTGRTAALRLDNRVRPQYGLPQGLPLSPVLLAIYMGSAPRHEGLFNYVDDFGLLATGCDHAEVKGTL